MSFQDPTAPVAAAEIQAAAAEDAAAAQQESTAQQIQFLEEALATQRADLDPFTQSGASFIDPLSDAVANVNRLSDLNAVGDIVGSGIFTALLDEANTRTLQNQAIRGRLGTGETPQFLQTNALRTGFDILGQERANAINQATLLANLVGQGQSAAAGQGAAALQTGANIAGTTQAGTSASNALLTDAAAANAAGIIGASNANANNLGQIADLATFGFTSFLQAPKAGGGLGAPSVGGGSTGTVPTSFNTTF